MPECRRCGMAAAEGTAHECRRNVPVNNRSARKQSDAMGGILFIAALRIRSGDVVEAALKDLAKDAWTLGWQSHHRYRPGDAVPVLTCLECGEDQPVSGDKR